jgi:hypothetical protein
MSDPLFVDKVRDIVGLYYSHPTEPFAAEARQGFWFWSLDSQENPPRWKRSGRASEIT